MSKPEPGPEAVVEALERLRQLSEGMAEREARLRDARRQREHLQRRRVEATRVAAQDQLKTRLAAAAEALRAAGEAADARAAARVQWIREAQRNVRKATLERIDAEEGRRKFELQRELLRATRERDAGLAAADATLAAFSTELAGRETELAGLETEARQLMGVYGAGLLRDLSRTPPAVPHEPARTEEALGRELAEVLQKTRADLSAFRGRLLPKLSRAWPVWLILALAPVLVGPALPHLGIPGVGYAQLGLGAGGFVVFAVLVHFLGRHFSVPAARRCLEGLTRARGILDLARSVAAGTHRADRARIEGVHAEITGKCNAGWGEMQDWLAERRAGLPSEVDTRAKAALAHNEALRQATRQRLERDHERTREELRAETEARLKAASGPELPFASGGTGTGAPPETEQGLAATWTREAVPALAFLRGLPGGEPPPDPAPDPTLDGGWRAPSVPTTSIRLGRVEIDADVLLAPLVPDSVAAPRPEPGTRWSLPLLLQFPTPGSLILEASPSRRADALGTLNAAVCRLLASTPPGRVAFTIFDPVGLGQSFSALTHLGDEAEHLIDGRIWTQSGQIEERLAELNEHLEKVIQMYLRNEYATIAEYNEQAGNIAEKYRFLVLADFPAGFTDLALRRLLSIAASGARCGVYLLVHWDTRRALPADVPPDALRQAALRLALDGPGVAIDERPVPGVTVRLDAVPETAALTEFIHRVARANRDSNRVEVPFEQIAPPDAELWSGDTAGELRVAIGRTGATKLQYLALGKGTRQHALIAGKTGSGKSTFFHVLITNLALWCPPDQVEFYLVDFKKGVEFKCYATHRLPHARVVAIESDREFGLSVLQRLDEELRRRGDLFRSAQVQDIAAYRRAPGAVPLPRLLLLVDEFQEFFVEEDRIAQNASVLLDRIVRQGRAFGMHVVLGSQTLGGAYTVARSTLGQMVVRIALQCNEADAFLIMDEDNPAPRLLSRPGEGIYNDEAGAKTGNSPFQVVWLSDEVRDRELRRIRALAEARLPEPRSPVVFEGDAPAEIRENPLLARLLSGATPAPRTAGTLRAWLGAPNAIKGPTEVGFARRAADNLLLVGQREEAMLGLLGYALVALAAQHARGGVRFFIFDASAPESPERATLERFARALPASTVLARPGDAANAVNQLSAELQSRIAAGPAGAEAPAWFLVVNGLQHFRALRQEDEFSFGSAESAPHPGAQFKELAAEGPTHGLHLLVACDTYNSVVRFLGRKALGEFGLRVLFQMSANDSASLIDNPAAGRLGMHRALLYQEREGSLEIFRPYALPDAGWLDAAERDLARLAAS